MTSAADPADRAPDANSPTASSLAASSLDDSALAANSPDGSAPAHSAPVGDAPEPDEKDWTWVLERPCPECGFDAGVVTGPQVAARLRQNAARWPAVCARADVRVRPQPRVWSPLEYACHVRDVCRVMDSRVNLLLSEEDPAFHSWDQDATAIEDAYGDQDPAAVGVELLAAAEAAAASFDSVGDDSWQRTGRRSNGSVFTIETLGQYFLHDLAHHLYDVRG
jgi:hypothetical protein